MVSVGLNELFWIALILFPARTVAVGLIVSRRPMPVAAAAPAIAALARNLRRLKYKLLGVISDERMSCVFLMSISNPSMCTPTRSRWIPTNYYLQLNRTLRL